MKKIVTKINKIVTSWHFDYLSV